MVARVQGKPEQIEHCMTRYERLAGVGIWVPTSIEHLILGRQLRRRAVLEWVEVSDGGKVVAVPKRFVFDEYARNPADGLFVPANRYTATLDERTFRVRSGGAEAGVFAVLDVEPATVVTPPKPPPLDANRIYMIVFVCAVIAAAVLIGVRRLKRA